MFNLGETFSCMAELVDFKHLEALAVLPKLVIGDQETTLCEATEALQEPWANNGIP